jgi:hypothetical protein
VDHVMIEDLDSGLLWFVEASGRAAVNCPPDGRLVELEPDEIKTFAPRIETVWKIRIGPKLRPDESVKRSEEALSLPRCATKDAPSKPLSYFPNSFTETVWKMDGRI